MRLEGLLSLLTCVMLLFLIGIGAGALRAELRDLVPPSSDAPSSSSRSDSD